MEKRSFAFAAVLAVGMMLAMGAVACDDGEGDDGGGGAGGAGGTGGEGGTGGTGGAECPDGQAEDPEGDCRPTCTETADCYELVAYCADVGDTDFCYGAEPGDPGNDCGRSALAPAKDASGPLLFASSQEGTCTKEPATCTNNGNVCAFTVFIFDPDADLPSSNNDLYANVFLIGPDGAQVQTYNVPTLDAGTGTLTVRGCFDAAETELVGAIQVKDQAGHNSNAQCFEGAP